MRSPIRALVWQEWHLARWPIAIVFACTSCVTLGCALLAKPLRVYFEAELAWGVAVGAYVCLVLFLTFWRGSTKDIDAGFPTRLFTLPVRTGALAATVFFSRLACVGISALLTAGLCCLYFGMSDALVAFPPALMLLMVYFQTVAWVMSGASPPVVILAAAFLFAPATLLMRALVSFRGLVNLLLYWQDRQFLATFEAEPLLTVTVLSGLLCFVGVVAYAIARISVGRLRHGTSIANAPGRIAEALPTAPGRTRPFASPMQ